jgi:hypothetical protein
MGEAKLRGTFQERKSKMSMSWKEIKKEVTLDCKTAILGTEEFLEKVKEGDTFFYLTSYCDKPNGIEKATFVKRLPKEEDSESSYLSDCERVLIESESSFNKNQFFTHVEFVNDFFWSCKMVVLDEKEASLISNRLEEYEADKNL